MVIINMSLKLAEEVALLTCLNDITLLSYCIRDRQKASTSKGPVNIEPVNITIPIKCSIQS